MATEFQRPSLRDAAALLLRAPDGRGKPLVLMRRETLETPHGANRWGLLNATRRGAETPTGTALRVAADEAGVDPGRIRVRGEQVLDPCEEHRDRSDGEHAEGLAAAAGSYWAVITDIAEPVALPPHHGGLAWVPEPDVTGLALQPAFAACWPALQVTESSLLVDAANVVGSRPDGWWRDRAGAAERLLRQIAATGPGVLAVQQNDFRWVGHLAVVLEGVARRAPDVAGVEVVRAGGSGDDTIVDLAHRDGHWIVVTADRGLRARLPPSTRSLGPTALRSWLAASETARGSA